MNTAEQESIMISKITVKEPVLNIWFTSGPNSSHYITVFHGRKRESFNLEKPIVDFAVVCASPYAKDIQDPSVVVVLLCDDIIAIDLTSHNFTQYPAPYGKYHLTLLFFKFLTFVSD